MAAVIEFAELNPAKDTCLYAYFYRPWVSLSHKGNI
jgi:hypothetical protein